MISNILNLLFIGSVVIVIIFELYVESRGFKYISKKDSGKTGTIINIIIPALLLIGFLSNNKFLMIDHDFDFNSHLNMVLSLLLVATGLTLRIMSVRLLGKFFKPTISLEQDHRVVKEGLYGRIRHPSYLGSILVFTGLIIRWNSWLDIVILILFLGVYLYRIKREEDFLKNNLGEGYGEYIKETKKIIPYIY